MEIIRSNIDTNNKREIYRLTKGDSVRVQDVEKGLTQPVDKWALYSEEYTKRDGGTENREVLAYISGGVKYATISPTFIRGFLEIVDVMGDEPFALIVTGGKSKGGREFVNCVMDCDWILGE